MSVIYVMIPAALALGAAAVLAFVWAVHRGQFDDLDTPPLRLLAEGDEPAPGPGPAQGNRPPSGRRR